MPRKSGKYGKIVHYFISCICGCLENILIEFDPVFSFAVNVPDYEFLKNIFILKCCACICLKQLLGRKTLRGP